MDSRLRGNDGVMKIQGFYESILCQSHILPRARFFSTSGSN